MWPVCRKLRIDSMLMMLPPRASARIRRATSVATKKAPLRLTSTTASQSCSVYSSVGLTIDIPELLTSTSMRPSSRSIMATAVEMDATSATSSCATAATPPAPRTSCASDCSASTRRAASPTFAPSRARTLAKCLPKPLDAPVISATLPATEKAWVEGMRQSIDRAAHRSTGRRHQIGIAGDHPATVWPAIENRQCVARTLHRLAAFRRHRQVDVIAQVGPVAQYLDLNRLRHALKFDVLQAFRLSCKLLLAEGLATGGHENNVVGHQGQHPCSV